MTFDLDIQHAVLPSHYLVRFEGQGRTSKFTNMQENVAIKGSVRPHVRVFYVDSVR